MRQIFGDFVELPKPEEYLTLGFSPSSISLKKRWKNNGLSADFIADYFKTFFMSNMNEKEEEDVVAIENIRNAVKYIANELLENAMKFQNKTVPFTAKIQFSLYHNKLVFCVTNGISEQQLESLQTFIKKLLNGEPEKLYIETMKANAWQANNTMTSGLGLLSMICDYSAKLGWKFEKQTDPPLITVTTVVCLDL